MKGTITAKFRKNQFHYASDPFKDGKERSVMILEPFCNVYKENGQPLAKNESSFFVDEKKGLIEGECYIVKESEARKWKADSKKSFKKYYPEVNSIISIKENL